MGEIVGMGQESSFEKRKELSIQEEKVKDDEKTVSIYDKNQRIFASNLKPLVDHKESGSTLQSSVKPSKGKYYVKGIHQSGRDNIEVATFMFWVDRDADYVVVYGVKVDMMAYTVNYQDAAGNGLPPSDTFYGNQRLYFFVVCSVCQYRASIWRRRFTIILDAPDRICTGAKKHGCQYAGNSSKYVQKIGN